MRWKANYWYYLIFALCFAGFQYLEESIRENYSGSNEVVIYLLGVMPNFLPAIGMPCVFFAMVDDMEIKSKAKLLHQQRHFTVLLFSQIGLIAWEVIQIWAPNGTFDWHDILWTMFGGIIFLLIWYMLSNSKNEKA